MINLLKCDEKKALELYTNRLASLTRYGLVLKGRAILVKYDDFIDRTDEILAILTRFFGLDSPLTANYATHRMTARIPGVGDPSNNIRSGRVIRTQAHNDIIISSATLDAGTAAFSECRERLHSVVSQANGEFWSDEAPQLFNE
jgi:hypothetical protein